MEAHGTVLVDQSVYMEGAGNSSSNIPVRNGTNSKGDGLLRRSASQQIYGCHGAVFPIAPRPSLYARGAFPAVMYQSLPPPPHPPLLRQSAACPPLLPLPLSRSFSLPTPCSPQLPTRRGEGGAAKVHPPGKGPKKARQPPARPGGGSRPRDDPKAAASAGGRGDEETTDPEDGGDFTGGEVYVLSPPANSLPMPSFFLRARAACSSSSSSSTCSSEVLGAVVPADGGVDAGASDELRQLLRL